MPRVVNEGDVVSEESIKERVPRVIFYGCHSDGYVTGGISFVYNPVTLSPTTHFIYNFETDEMYIGSGGSMNQHPQSKLVNSQTIKGSLPKPPIPIASATASHTNEQGVQPTLNILVGGESNSTKKPNGEGLVGNGSDVGASLVSSLTMTSPESTRKKRK